LRDGLVNLIFADDDAVPAQAQQIFRAQYRAGIAAQRREHIHGARFDRGLDRCLAMPDRAGLRIHLPIAELEALELQLTFLRIAGGAGLSGAAADENPAARPIRLIARMALRCNEGDIFLADILGYCTSAATVRAVRAGKTGSLCRRRRDPRPGWRSPLPLRP